MYYVSLYNCHNVPYCGGFLVAEEVFRHFAHIYANHFLRNFMETDQIISLTCSGLNLIIMFIKFQSD